MKLENQVPGVTHKILFLPRGAKELVSGDLSTTHSASHDGVPVLIDQTTGTAYVPAEVSGVSSGPEQEAELRTAGYHVLERSQLFKLRGA